MNAQNTELLITCIQISIYNSVPAENRTKETVLKQIEKFYSAAHLITDDPEPLSEAQKSYIENKIFDNMYLAVPEGQTIINRKSNFKHWLHDCRADINFFYWDRYNLKSPHYYSIQPRPFQTNAIPFSHLSEGHAQRLHRSPFAVWSEP